jgi:PhzF family phenazine biosynthesis protein
MRNLPFKHVDVFTAQAFAGNPAAVIPSPDGMTDEQMQHVAREMNLSATSYVLPARTKSADLRLRWFTPVTEINLCGHATVAALYVLAEEGMYGMQKPGEYQLRVDTASGVLPVSVKKKEDGISVKAGLPLPRLQRIGELKVDFHTPLGISIDAYDKRLHSVANVNAYLPVKRLATLYEMQPNFELLKSVLHRRKLTGVCVFSTETIDRASNFHSRFFAPNEGVSEDPVTGVTHASLGVYMIESGIIPKVNGITKMLGEQGDVIGRSGRVEVEVTVTNETISSVAISGTAVTIFEGTLKI